MLANLDDVIPILSDQASQNQWALSSSWFAPKCINGLSVRPSVQPALVGPCRFHHDVYARFLLHAVLRCFPWHLQTFKGEAFVCMQVSSFKQNDHVSQIVLLKLSLFMFILGILAVVWHKLILTLSSPFWVRAPSPTTSPTFWRRLSEGWMRSTWKIKPYQYILQIFAGEYWPRNRTRCIMIGIWAE